MKVKTTNGYVLADVDETLAEQASNRIVLAYELADMLYDYSEQASMGEALVVAQIVLCYGLLDQQKAPERRSISEFGKCFRLVRRCLSKLGDKARLRDVLIELHLEDDSNRRPST